MSLLRITSRNKSNCCANNYDRLSFDSRTTLDKTKPKGLFIARIQCGEVENPILLFSGAILGRSSNSSGIRNNINFVNENSCDKKLDIGISPEADGVSRKQIEVLQVTHDEVKIKVISQAINEVRITKLNQEPFLLKPGSNTSLTLGDKITFDCYNDDALFIYKIVEANTTPSLKRTRLCSINSNSLDTAERNKLPKRKKQSFPLNDSLSNLTLNDSFSKRKLKFEDLNSNNKENISNDLIGIENERPTSLKEFPQRRIKNGHRFRVRLPYPDLFGDLRKQWFVGEAKTVRKIRKNVFDSFHSFIFEIYIAYDNKLISTEPVAYPCEDVQQILPATNGGLQYYALNNNNEKELAYDYNSRTLCIGDLVDCCNEKAERRGRITDIKEENYTCSIAFVDGKYKSGISMSNGNIRCVAKSSQNYDWVLYKSILERDCNGKIRKGTVLRAKMVNGDIETFLIDFGDGNFVDRTYAHVVKNLFSQLRNDRETTEVKMLHSKSRCKTKTDRHDNILHKTEIELKEKEECKELKIKRTEMKDKVECENKKEELLHYKASSMKSKGEVKRNSDSSFMLQLDLYRKILSVSLDNECEEKCSSEIITKQTETLMGKSLVLQREELNPSLSRAICRLPDSSMFLEYLQARNFISDPALLNKLSSSIFNISIDRKMQLNDTIPVEYASRCLNRLNDANLRWIDLKKYLLNSAGMDTVEPLSRNDLFTECNRAIILETMSRQLKEGLNLSNMFFKPDTVRSALVFVSCFAIRYLIKCSSLLLNMNIPIGDRKLASVARRCVEAYCSVCTSIVSAYCMEEGRQEGNRNSAFIIKDCFYSVLGDSKLNSENIEQFKFLFCICLGDHCQELQKKLSHVLYI